MSWTLYKDLLPNADSTLDIGSTALHFANGYFDNLYSGSTGFLKLDCSNDPLTGGLGIETSDIIALSVGSSATDYFKVNKQSYSYILSDSVYSYDGTDYIGSADLGGEYAFWWDGTTVTVVTDPTVDFTPIDGMTGIDCGLYVLAGTYNLSVWYMHGEKTDFETWLTSQIAWTGGSGVYLGENLLVPTDGIYAYAGDPTGWDIVATYTDPPDAAETIVAGAAIDAFGRFRVTSTSQFLDDIALTGDLNIAGQINIGGTGIPINDWAIQGIKHVTLTSGTAAALNFLLQSSTAGGVSANLYALTPYLALYGDSNYTGGLKLLGGQYRLDINNNTCSVLYGGNINVTATAGAGYDSGNSNFTSFYGWTYDFTQEGSATLTGTNVYGFKTPINLGSATIGTHYGFFASDLSSYATTSWGIYNEDRTYLGNTVILPANVKIQFDSTDTNIYANTDDPEDLIIAADQDILLQADNQVVTDTVIRGATSLYRRYYHLPISGFDPGASGATWTAPTANHTGGFQLNAVGEVLYFDTDVHTDWDGASDLNVEVYFAVNVDNTGGGAGDTVDLKLVCYYNTVGDTATKTQTQEVATVVGASAQYKVFKSVHTINFDETDNVVEAGDIMGFALNLETDTSEVDDIIVLHGAFYYNSSHVGIESGDV